MSRRFWLVGLLVSALITGCGGGSTPTVTGAGGQSGGGGGPAVLHKQAFLTYSTYQGNEGGAAADAACNKDGAIGFQGRVFAAWLSTSTEDARARVGDGPWWVGSALLGTVADLATNQLATTFNRTPTGSMVAHGEYVWTGTRSGGLASTETCADWTSAELTRTGTMGQVGYAAASWTDATTPTCNHGGHFYCLEK